MSKFILSTATCDQKFVEYRKGANGSPNVPLRSVLIKGGANLPSMKSGFGELTNTDSGQPLWTPRGTVTKVSDEDLELLLAHEGFRTAVKAGFYQVTDHELGDSHQKVARAVADDMKDADRSAPLNPKTLQGAVKVTTSLIVNDDDD